MTIDLLHFEILGSGRIGIMVRVGSREILATCGPSDYASSDWQVQTTEEEPHA